MDNNRIKDETKKAWVVSAIMGMGHTRAAYPLRDIAAENIIIEGSKDFAPAKKYEMWHRMANTYYVFSRATGISIIGTYALSALQNIPKYYPRRDLSKPTAAVKYLSYLIKNVGLGSTVVDKVKTKAIPVINTFYATAIAIDMAKVKQDANYLLICDADINRVWVPEDPKISHIKYMVPCTQVKKRLLSYGVRQENIFLTGFPLPKENIGELGKLEILKQDLLARLLRLDPQNKFFKIHEKEVMSFLGITSIPQAREDVFSVSFSVGGAGAQQEMAQKILSSLKIKIIKGKIRVNLSAGTQKPVYDKFMEYIGELKLNEYVDKGISIIYDENMYLYFDKFNKMLRGTDVLWTKPSELSFYCGLGIPILIAPAVGVHEELNRNWLHEIHAGVDATAEIEYTDEWLFDLRENGRLAEAAWDGFLKARKLGTYRIEELITTGKSSISDFPLE